MNDDDCFLMENDVIGLDGSESQQYIVIAIDEGLNVADVKNAVTKKIMKNVDCTRIHLIKRPSHHHGHERTGSDAPAKVVYSRRPSTASPAYPSMASKTTAVKRTSMKPVKRDSYNPRSNRSSIASRRSSVRDSFTSTGSVAESMRQLSFAPSFRLSRFHQMGSTNLFGDHPGLARLESSATFADGEEADESGLAGSFDEIATVTSSFVDGEQRLGSLVVSRPDEEPGGRAVPRPRHSFKFARMTEIEIVKGSKAGSARPQTSPGVTKATREVKAEDPRHEDEKEAEEVSDTPFSVPNPKTPFAIEQTRERLRLHLLSCEAEKACIQWEMEQAKAELARLGSETYASMGTPAIASSTLSAREIKELKDRESLYALISNRELMELELEQQAADMEVWRELTAQSELRRDRQRTRMMNASQGSQATGPAGPTNPSSPFLRDMSAVDRSSKSRLQIIRERIADLQRANLLPADLKLILRPPFRPASGKPDDTYRISNDGFSLMYTPPAWPATVGGHVTGSDAAPDGSPSLKISREPSRTPRGTSRAATGTPRFTPDAALSVLYMPVRPKSTPK